MSEIKPVYETRETFRLDWIEVDEERYNRRIEDTELYEGRILYPAAAYEALQKENERLKVDLYGMQEAKKAQFNIRKANQEEAHKLLNEACDDNAMKQQTIISLKYEINGMHDLNAAQAKRIEDLTAKSELKAHKMRIEIEALRKQVETLGHKAPTASGFCSRDGGCVCGGDLPRIRESCSSWVKPASKNGE